MALTTGNIAFVGYNADGNDNIAFVALVDINPGEVIIFEDNEWNGTAWVDTNEGAFSWTATSLVTAGTIVRIDNIGSGTITANQGTVIDASALSPSRGTNRGISASDEVIYAYQGSAASPTFITAIASGGFNATNGLLTNTGLTAGLNALDLSTLDDDADVAAFNGDRSGQANFSAYLPIINNPTNWIVQDGGGDQSIDTIAPDVPFSSTAFTLGAVSNAGITLTQTGGSTNVTEGGATDTYTIVLNSQPTADVIIALNSGTQVTTSTNSLTFTAANWNVAQNLTVTAFDDAVLEGSHSGAITHSVTSTDANYNGLAISNVTANITDNDVASPANFTMQITEYLYSGADGEFVELTNLSPNAIDLTGWSYSDSGRNPGSFSLSAFGIVQPGESVIFTETADVAAFRTAWGLANSVKVIGGSTPGLGRGDEINIYDASNVLVDRLTYSDELFPGTVRTQEFSASTDQANLAPLAINPNWQLSAVGDTQNSRASVGGAVGNPGTYNTNLVVAPTVRIVESGGTTTATEGGATDSLVFVLSVQPTADVTIALNGGTQVTTSTNSLTFTATNWNIAQVVTVTAIDDAVVEGNHIGTITQTVTSADAQYNNIPIAPITVAITDNDFGVLPIVNLSVSSNTTSESSRNQITVTATASAAVSGNQTVTLNVGGTGITPGDYSVSTRTLTIPNGQTTATATFVATDDGIAEGTETAVLSLSNPASGIALGTTTTQNIAITNNNSSLLTKIGGFTSSNGGEIPAFDPISDRLFVVSGSVVEILNLANPANPTKIGDLAFNTSGDPDGTTAGGFALIPNSVAVGKAGTVSAGIVAVAIAITNQTTADNNPGEVQFFNAATGAFISKVNVGFLPDMLAFTPDGTKVLTANEGQPNNAYTTDPVGSVSIINLAGGVATPTVQEASFTPFDSQIDALKASGVRIFGPGSSVAQDLEPEYITFSGDGTKAWVTLQENNAIAVVNIATATIESILPLGVKDYNITSNALDASDRDVDGTSGGGGKVNIQNQPVIGLYQPDAIASYTVNGQTYYVTANEGDTRDYDGFSEEATVSSLNLDPIAFPDAANLKLPENLGRLLVTKTLGDTDGDGDYDQLYTFGARSFTIWDSAGERVYDSGADFERITAAALPGNYNSNNDSNNFDNRSDNKGPEPEGVVIGAIANRIYAFIGLERVGGVMVYEVTNPNSPQFVQYVNTRDFSVNAASGLTDSGPEGLAFISANDSPNSKPLLVVANEISKTTAIFEVNTPTRISDIQGTSHTSPFVGQVVTAVPGIVTAVDSNGFYLQDPHSDTNIATSEAIFVFTSSAPTVKVGDSITVTGTVSEFTPGGVSTGNLSTTQIGGNPTITILSSNNSLPAATIIGAGGRIPPTQVIDNDGLTSFDPTTDGIDFFESLEGMRVTAKNLVAVSPTNRFGEIYAVVDNGVGATGLSQRGTINISPNDFNPERIQIDADNGVFDFAFPNVNVGAKLGDVTGVVGYNFGN
ncbi:hypothetical protein FJR38_04595, partial [Anabaena sp. UHCC 0253]|uniref:choice-of-anchor I family protein n=1 Tax=Anabaena sp. UHCC 0253 TaxID=2590019 RepID=UPI001580FD37